MRYYTGVGSRKTPFEICDIMSKIAQQATSRGVILRSGGALGADSAFEKGCDLVSGPKEIYYANDCTDESMNLAAQFHPAWHNCSDFAKKLHGRNSFQVLGRTLNVPSLCLVCWTPDGCISHTTRSSKTGGTGTAISIAEAYNVPIFNLAINDHLNIWLNWLI